jgi:hypothetical protein
MTLTRPFRSASLGLVLACGLTPGAQANDWFPHKCRSGCADTTVTLPAQRVVVESRAPRVTYEETTRVSRGVIAPVFGGYYMPMAFPVATIGIAASGQRDIETTQPDNALLRSIHEADVAGSIANRAQAIARSDFEYVRGIHERSASRSASARQTTTTRDATNTGDACDGLDKQVTALNEKVDKIVERVNAVEKLLLIHDNYIKSKLPNPPAMEPAK